MGACGTKNHVIHNESPHLMGNQLQFLAMGITQSKLAIFHQHFKTIDTNNTNTITVSQIVEHFGFEKNEFIRKAFSVLILDKASDTLSFRDFVLTLWNFCTLGDDLGLFVFGVYDFDGNKELDHEEATELMTDLHGSAKSGRDFDELTARILRQKKMGSYGVHEHYFKQYCEKHPGFLCPAAMMQASLKKKLIGDKWWDGKASEQRRDFCDGNFESVTSISNRLKKEEYETTEVTKHKEITRKYLEYGVIIPTDEDDDYDSGDEETDEVYPSKKKLTRRNFKTSTRRRGSMSSGASTGSVGSSDGCSLKRSGSNRSLSRRGSGSTR